MLSSRSVNWKRAGGGSWERDWMEGRNWMDNMELDWIWIMEEGRGQVEGGRGKGRVLGEYSTAHRLQCPVPSSAWSVFRYLIVLNSVTLPSVTLLLADDFVFPLASSHRSQTWLSSPMSKAS